MRSPMHTKPGDLTHHRELKIPGTPMGTLNPHHVPPTRTTETRLLLLFMTTRTRKYVLSKFECCSREREKQSHPKDESSLIFCKKNAKHTHTHTHTRGRICALAVPVLVLPVHVLVLPVRVLILPVRVLVLPVRVLVLPTCCWHVPTTTVFHSNKKVFCPHFIVRLRLRSVGAKILLAQSI